MGGVQQIVDKTAAKFQDSVRLNTPVRSVDHSDPAKIAVTSYRGEVFEGKRVILAMSPTMNNRIDFHPAMPANRMQLTQRIPMGSTIKAHCVYPQPFWREKGLTGFVYYDKGPLSFLLDNTPADGTPGMIVAFLEAQEARNFDDQPQAVVKQLMVEQIVTHLGPEGAYPIFYNQMTWDAQQWSGGCYAGIFGPGVWTSYPDVLRKPVGRVHFAGTETATAWFAYMDGAISSGQRAADEVSAFLSLA